MAFKVKPEESEPGQDCKDFKPMFLDRNACKSSDKCNFKEQDYIEEERGSGYCMGIKHKNKKDYEDPPKDGSGVLLSNP